MNNKMMTMMMKKSHKRRRKKKREREKMYIIIHSVQYVYAVRTIATNCYAYIVCPICRNVPHVYTHTTYTHSCHILAHK